jgi:tRNA pseudouridine55 synthase
MNTIPTTEELKEGTVILIDKPLRWTSFDALNKLRWLVKMKKIGHAGTLDPLATGLLICCTGKMTKKITEYQKQEKEYTGIIHLGAVTPTYDLESEPEQQRPFEQLTDDEIHAATAPFTGDILQIPPAHSAIKKDGKRVYELAREGIEVKLDPRPVNIKVFEITKIALPEVHFRVVCSTGTYIRSLANDFGAVLGCGGYLRELRRTKIGEYNVDDALTVEQWVKALKPE